jgi:hypothetical protein
MNVQVQGLLCDGIHEAQEVGQVCTRRKGAGKCAHARRENMHECCMCNACMMLRLLGDERVSVGIIAQQYT